MEDFALLRSLWIAYESSCSKEKCPICEVDNDDKLANEDSLDKKDAKIDKDDEDDKNLQERLKLLTIVKMVKEVTGIWKISTRM